MPKHGPWQAYLNCLLLTNVSTVPRERLTLIRLFNALGECGYEHGYDAVRRHVGSWRCERRFVTTDGLVPLPFASCAAYQFDRSHKPAPTLLEMALSWLHCRLAEAVWAWLEKANGKAAPESLHPFFRHSGGRASRIVRI